MKIRFIVFLFSGLLFGPSLVMAQAKPKKPEPEKEPEKAEIPQKTENPLVQKEIDALRRDYLLYKEGIIRFSETADYLVRRQKSNEEKFQRAQVDQESRLAKARDIVERAKLLRLLEQRLDKYEKNPDPTWTPELLWRTAVIYQEIAEELFLYYISNDEATGKEIYDEEYQDILKRAHELAKGTVRPAEADMGIDFFRKKSEENLRKLVIHYPQFRDIGSVLHLLARIYEKPPFSLDDPDEIMPAKLSLASVCGNWGFSPFSDDLRTFLTRKGLEVMPPTAMGDYTQWTITDFPAHLPFDPFATCRPIKGNTEFLGTAWATLGKYLSATNGLGFLAEARSDREVLFNLALTKWYSLSAYKQALGPEFRSLSTRGYIVYFSGLMMYQNDINSALGMQLFDQVVLMGQNLDENSPHEAAIKYIGFLLQEEKYIEGESDPERQFSWTAPFEVKCTDKCPMKKLTTFYKGRENEPHVKRIWKGVADFFMGYEENRTYQRSETDYNFAYELYDYIFRNMTVEGGWRHNPDKPAIFWNMISLIDMKIQAIEREIIEVRSERDKNTLRGQLSTWQDKKREIYQFAVNKAFTNDEIQQYLISHQRFLNENMKKNVRLRAMTLDQLREELLRIRVYALIDTGQAMISQAMQVGDQAKEATGAEKAKLSKKALEEFERVIAYYMEVIRDYPNSSMEYTSMYNILIIYHSYIIDLASSEEQRREFIQTALNWGRRVRDSHLGSRHQRDAAEMIYSIYDQKMDLKIPEPPFDVKDEDKKVRYEPRELTADFKDYIQDAYEYMKIFPAHNNSPVFFNNIADIYLHFGQIEEARKLYWQILEKYCTHTAAMNASIKLFLSYKFQDVDPAAQSTFVAEREAAIKRLEKQKCGGDKEHRELMMMISALEFNELVKKAEDVFAEAEALKKDGKNDTKKWRETLLIYRQLETMMKDRRPDDKETAKVREFEKNLFGVYWKIYTCYKELGDYPGAIEILHRRIYEEPTGRMMALAHEEAYKQEILFELAQAATKFFMEDLALKMWQELTVVKAGAWRIRRAGGKIDTREESTYRILAEENLFSIYRTGGPKQFNRALAQADRLLEIFRKGKKTYNRVFEVSENDMLKQVAQRMGVSEENLENFYMVRPECSGGKCRVTVSDKTLFYTDIVFNMHMDELARKTSSETVVRDIISRIEQYEKFLDGYVPLAKVKSKENESMWKARLDLMFRKANHWKMLQALQTRHADRAKKAGEEYVKLLEEYKQLYDQGVREGLDPGIMVINYAIALIQFAENALVRSFENPFSEKTTVEIDAYERVAMNYQTWVKQLQGKSDEIVARFNKLEEDKNKIIQEVQAELVELVTAIQLIQKVQAEPGSVPNKDVQAAVNKYQSLNKKYPNFIKDLSASGDFAAAAQKTIMARKDITAILKEQQSLGAASQKLSPDSNSKFLRDQLPHAQKALASVKKRYSGQNNPAITKAEDILKKIKPDEGKMEDIQQLLANVLPTLAFMSVFQSATNTVTLMLGNGSALDNLARGYDWYKEQKGVFRKQVAQIKGDLLALKMQLLYRGIRAFEEAPNPVALAREAMKDEEEVKKSGCTQTKAEEKETCFLKWSQKTYYQQTYRVTIDGKEQDLAIVPLDKITDEYNKTFATLYELVEAEKLSSGLIEEALEEYRVFSGKKSLRRTYLPEVESLTR